MTKRDIRKYLLLKRKFTTRRVISIEIINFIFSALVIYVLLDRHYYITSVLFLIVTLMIISLCIFTQIKGDNSEQSTYLFAAISLLHFYIIMGVLAYIFINLSLSLYIYLLTYFLLSTVMIYISYFYLRLRLKSRKLSRKYSESYWFMVIIIVVIVSVSPSRIILFESVVLKVTYSVLWIIIGSYTIADTLLNSELYKKIE